MLETLEPQVPQEKIPLSNDSINKEILDDGIGLKNVEFLDYLGLKDEMFNQSVMEKVGLLAKHFEDVKDLMTTDMNLGTKEGLTKLDKLYAFVSLRNQEIKLDQEKELINKAKQCLTQQQ